MTGRPQGERGFALPAVIFLVALLTLLLTTGLARVQADRQIAEAAEATADAFTVAQSGLQNYIGTRTARPPDGDSVRINVTGGYANVIAHLIQNPADTNLSPLYLVRSTGIVIDPLAGPDPQARRVMTQFATWQTAWIRRRAALTSIFYPTNDEGSDPVTPRVFSGIDECGVEPAVPGVRTTGSAPTTDVTYIGAPGLLLQGSGASLTIATETGIDWYGALSPSFVPDYTSFQNGNMTFPIQRVYGDLVLEGGFTGSGLLIVQGNLRPWGVNSGFYFEGVILVGEGFNMDADSNVVRGMVVTGLKRLEGWTPGTRTDYGGPGEISRITFNSCLVNQALAGLRGMVGVENAWQDVWGGY